MGTASSRISSIVEALKAYSNMDQAPVQLVDLNAALDTTIDPFQSRLDGITIVREYAPDLPRIEAYGSELNQIWTHLPDNAAYALDGPGQITLRTRSEGTGILVEIEDTGLRHP